MNRHSDAVAAGAILALGLALYLPGLGAEVLRHPLEAKYALVAREMLAGGPRLVPHVYGELFPDKPPLYFWATATLGWLRGGRIDEVTARLPAVAAALAGVLLVRALGRDLFSARAGLCAAAALATSNLFFWYARQGHLDQFLTAFVTLAGFALWRGLTASRPRQAAGWMAVAYGAMALGVLSKGLIGLAIPMLAAVVYGAATGPLRALPARLRLGTGLGVFLAVVLTWFAPAVVQYGPGYFYETVVHQHVVRYAATWAHAGPWYYYFGEFPAGFFPWIVFLPSAIVLGWRAGDETARSAAVPGPRPFLFPLAWFVAGFVFFSLATGKRGPYLLPIYPAAALMVGWLWDRALGTPTRSRWVGVPVAAMCAVTMALALALLVVPRPLIPGHTVSTLLPADPRQLAAAVAAVVTAMAGVWLLWRRGLAAGVFAALVAVQAALLLGVATVRASRYEAEFPVRAFAARVRTAVPAGQPVFSLFEDYNNIVAFYLDRPLKPLAGPEALAAVRHAGVPVFVLVGPDERLDGAVAVAATAFERRPVSLVRLDPLPGRS